MQLAIFTIKMILVYIHDFVENNVIYFGYKC